MPHGGSVNARCVAAARPVSEQLPVRLEQRARARAQGRQSIECTHGEPIRRKRPDVLVQIVHTPDAIGQGRVGDRSSRSGARKGRTPSSGCRSRQTLGRDERTKPAWRRKRRPNRFRLPARAPDTSGSVSDLPQLLVRDRLTRRVVEIGEHDHAVRVVMRAITSSGSTRNRLSGAAVEARDGCAKMGCGEQQWFVRWLFNQDFVARFDERGKCQEVGHRTTRRRDNLRWRHGMMRGNAFDRGARP